jgi:uncharacterized protein (TIGR02117 family)
MRVVKRIALGLASLIGATILFAILGIIVPNPLVPDEISGEPALRRILIVSNPIHTDIAIPIEPQSLETFGFLGETSLPISHPEAEWLLFGWGSRAFYLDTPSLADMKPGPTFKALTLDSSVMHVDVLGAVDEANPVVMALDVSERGYAQLLTEISKSFTRVDGRVLPIDGFALGTSDKFFEGEGSFTALLGCNTWTARMLRSAGLRTGWWTPLPLSLTTSLSLFNRLPGPSDAAGWL